MGAKTVILYSLPYLVAAMSLVVWAHQAIPSLKAFPSLPGTSANNEMFFSQSVNRNLKGDRLPTERAIPQASEKAPAKIPTPIAPTRKTIII